MTSRDNFPPEIFPKHEFAGGRLCLDFCNTLSRGPGEGPRDRIDSAAAFSAWANRLGRMDVSPPGPDELAALREFRRALLAIIDATVENTVPNRADLQVLEAEIADFRRSERLVPAANGGFTLMDSSVNPVEKLRHDIARDAAEILVGGEISRIKRCPDDTCRWVFFDASKNFSRRWCAMDDCGARDKVRRFRRRQAAF
jgi:predicted RNA-binding Zn ribbon-like protein